MITFPQLRFRQVHLDFHTSEHINDVGANFDETQFIGALKKGHVNSVTLFAMCHHGWSYYDTKVGKPHPHMKTDLLPRMLKACKAADIEAPVYITAGWNERMAEAHPDWLRKEKNGTLQYMPAPGKPDEARPWGWRTLCFNTPYVDFLCEVAREVVSKLDPVGIFFDITFERACYCENCTKSMIEAGLDPNDEAAATKFQRQVYVNYLNKTSQAIWSLNPKTRVFHNGASNRRGCDDFYPYYSHFEVESLPTGGWGYDHYPLNAKYFSRRGMDFLGMTGKFHRSWGEFGGFKGPNALKFECVHMLSLGSKCSVGDQLHPSGRMDEDTYRLIGEAYKLVEQREAFAKGLIPVSDIAVVCASTALGDPGREDAETGACKMLLETQHQFDIVDNATLDFSKYRVIILPDEVPVSGDFGEKLEKFIAAGGAVLLTGESGVDKAIGKFNVDCGAQYLGKSEWDVDYTVVGDTLATNMVRSPYLNFMSGLKTKATGEAEILARTVSPYFNRTYRHFCSHGVTPPSGKDAGYPSVVRKGSVIYIAHKVFTMYKESGMKLHRDLVNNCLGLLLPDPLVKTSLQSLGRVYLGTRTPGKELILNLLYCAPIKRGIEVVEDIVPLFDISVRLRVDGRKVNSVSLPLSGQKLDFRTAGNYIEFSIPKLELHETVIVE